MRRPELKFFTWLLLLLGMSIPLAAPLRAQDSTATASSVPDSSKLPSPTGAMIRSALFPGWGQWYNGKKWKAALVFAVETGIVADAVYWHKKAEKTDSADERALYLEYRNRDFWYLGLAILLSVGDAYVDAQLAGFDVSPDLSWRPGGPMVGFALVRRF